MHHRSGISLCKLLCRNPLRNSPKPTFTTHLGHGSIPFSSKSNFVNNPSSSPRIFPNPNGQITESYIGMGRSWREFGTESGGDVDVNKEMDQINLKFVEAREEIDMAMESKETVYFDEEAECARTAVKEVVEMFDGLLGKLPENKKAAVQRSMGLKIEQLKAELQQLNE